MEPAANRRTAVLVSAVLGALVLVTGCGGGGANGGPAEDGGGGYGRGSASPAEIEPGQPEVVATGLEVPWGLVFLPDGSALVSQRDSAGIAHVSGDGTVTDVGTVEEVSPVGEGGLLGLALHPDFPDEPYVYAYHTSESDNRISRMEYDREGGSLGEAEVVLDGIPSSSHHDGGRIAFGPDGLLYVGTGDAGRSRQAQNTDSLAGKILRVTPEGEPAPGNPFDNRVYSYGHRNVQGLAWDEEGNLYATEFGADKLDEVNLVEAGNNYGWPEVEGPGGGDEYVDPLVTWSPEEASPSGAAIAGGSLWVAALRGERLWEVPLTEDGLGEPVAHYQEEYGRLRTVATAPGDDGLWLTTSNRDALGNPVAEDDRVLRVPLE
ncbi:glucose sorbosone dehydrogenase [Nocardiopsis sp. TSRI0078]|uniref:PQQ-dependent sugar dehydrogenase n=1 Tax=unclassified Nocardiopsis TaxID=2649073 RepID=UPI00093D2B53|nr:PQQ-dependent sugar dehydrogenase [Nocardiopsis sp. TSRI0078]OKI23691.1 glucose sorbosone dehydrogenase [Nocardiopsis sp. TSRI0078]